MRDLTEDEAICLSAISTAALGYWKEGDAIKPEYDTVVLRDVAKLYQKYVAGKEAMRKAMEELGVPDAYTPPTVAAAFDHLHRTYYAGIEFCSDYKPASVEA